AAPARRAGTLAAVIGVGHAGPVAVDLVADGPHAVVAGTTGSGKSELLVTWMAALAAAHPPEEVTVLLVDFKGGAAFDPLLVLPHAVGLVTDLDGQGARRALESLRAEVRHRERVLRDAGARDVD
ncbi:cell division protein FtsK, partial [Clavibacter nebraskensis]